MHARTLLFSIAGAFLSLGMATWVVDMTTENNRAMEAKRAMVVAGRQPMDSPRPATDQGAKLATPEAGLAALANKLRTGTLDARDRAVVEAKVGLARDALSDDNRTRFDGFMMELAAMDQALDVECTVQADLDGQGRPVVSVDAATGRVVLHGTCWAQGPGATQRASGGALVHATDFDADALVADMAQAREAVGQAEKRGFVYGSKSKGQTHVDWLSDAFGPARGGQADQGD